MTPPHTTSLLRRLAPFLAASLFLLAATYYLLALWPLRDLHPLPYVNRATLVLQDATVYQDPDSPPLHHATILIESSRIVSVQVPPPGSPPLPLPPGAQLIPCHACTVTSGFWNAHVHFTQPQWLWSEWKSTRTLNADLATMLTSHGFTTVVDTGSNLRSTIPLRRRTESGDLLGPYIYTAGGPLYPPHGIPYYLRDTLPRFLQLFMAQPATPTAAVSSVRTNIGDGADLLKLFTGSYIERETVLPMPVEIATAAVATAHQNHQLAFAHPSDLSGIDVALASGVDVLAHAPDSTDGITPALIQSLVAHHMAMIPTLKMFATTVTTRPTYLNPIYDIVRQFHTDGGDLLFGTDVGYMTDPETTDEFLALQRSGLDFHDILRMLTTAPAARFGVDNEKGQVRPGQLADLVVLQSDPADDITAFAKVQTTIRSGRILYSHP